VTVDDLGNTGSGAPGQDEATIPITVVSRIYDFNIQRGTSIITDGNDSLTLQAGTGYVAPSGPAFVRLVDTRLTAMVERRAARPCPPTSGWSGWTMPIPSTRRSPSPASAPPAIPESAGRSSSTPASPMGPTHSPVRRAEALQFVSNELEITSSAITGVVSDADVAVIITGQASPDAGQGKANSGMATSDWVDADNEVVLTRGEHENRASVVSYAVVEFTGSNWTVQRL